MLTKTSCHRVLTTHASLAPLINGLQAIVPADFPLSVEEIPTLATIFPRLGKEVESDPFLPHIPLPRRGMQDVLLYLHSSGSTGFPKPIPCTNQTILAWNAFCEWFQYTTIERD